jgi:hypothetical protein
MVSAQVKGRVTLTDRAGRKCIADPRGAASDEIPACDCRWEWEPGDDADSVEIDSARSSDADSPSGFARFEFPDTPGGDYRVSIDPTEEGDCSLSVEGLGRPDGACGERDGLEVVPGLRYEWRVRWGVARGNCWARLQRIGMARKRSR